MEINKVSIFKPFFDHLINVFFYFMLKIRTSFKMIYLIPDTADIIKLISALSRLLYPPNV